MKGKELIDFLNAQADFLEKHMAHLYDDFGESTGIPKMKMFRESAKALEAANQRIALCETLLVEIDEDFLPEGQRGDCRYCDYDGYIYKKHDKHCLAVQIHEALKGAQR